MGQAYYQQLPKDYFRRVYYRVFEKLGKHQNVCVSAMYGCGSRTFLNFFLHYYQKEPTAVPVCYYDPLVAECDLVDFTKDCLQREEPSLIVTHHFQRVEEPRMVLEALSRFRQPDPRKVTYLMITDHSGVTNPTQTMARSSVFFPERIYLPPFDLAQTVTMLDITKKFYGWQIDPGLYEKIFNLAGGIPRIIKHIGKDLCERHLTIDDRDQFMKNPVIHFQLEYCTDLLLKYDKAQLQELGLLVDQQIHGGILRKYFKQYQSDFIHEAFPQLSSLETSILSYLYEQKAQIVSIDRIGDLLELKGHDFSLWAIYKHISRMKEKIKPRFAIENVKGKGYMLQDQDQTRLKG